MRHLLIFLMYLSSTSAFAAVIHVGSFSSEHNAQKIQSRLQNLGHRAIIKKQRVRGRWLNSVLIKDLNNTSAQNICSSLKSNHIDCYVKSGGLVRKTPSAQQKTPINKAYRKYKKPKKKPRINEYRRSKRTNTIRLPSRKNNIRNSPNNNRYIKNRPPLKQIPEMPYIPGNSDFNL